VARTIYPDAGSLVRLAFAPRAGEAGGSPRAALVLSAEIYHHRTPLAVVCPIVAEEKGYPFEVVLPPGLALAGIVLADHVCSIDRAARGLEVVGSVPAAVLAEVRAKLEALLGT
jgi:mRNA interferase MazF